MKTTINILLIIAGVAFVLYFLEPCKPIPTVVHTEKYKYFHDTITRIKKEYQTQILTVQQSHRPDTFIRNLTDTVFGNHDSFIYVTVLKGRECCAEIPWKDSIINLDSIMMERSEANLKKQTKKVHSLKVWQRILIGLSFVLGGALVVK